MGVRNLSVMCLGVAMVTAAGCGQDFEPRTLLNKLTVLALFSEPIEAVGDEEVRLTARIFAPPGDELVEEEWRFCPLTAGAQAGYRCLLPACEQALESEAAGRARVNPWQLGQACLAVLAAGGGAQDLEGAALGELPEPLETVVFYRARSASGEEREAVLRLPLYLGEGPRERNRHPEFLGVAFDGGDLVAPAELAGHVLPAMAGRGEVEILVVIDEESLDEYRDEADRLRVEEPVVSFYATVGRFEWERGAGTEIENRWKARRLEEGDEEAELYFVVRDLRGGQAVVGPTRIPLEP